jgi:hypothetical protein
MDKLSISNAECPNPRNARPAQRRPLARHSTTRSRFRTDCFKIESLERRTFLTGTIPVEWGVTLAGDLNYSTDHVVHVSSGFTSPTSSFIQAGANDQMEYLPTGTMYLQWYGGKVAGTVPIAIETGTSFGQPYSYPSPQETTVTLSVADAGPPIPKGFYAGDYVLYSYYTGDNNFSAESTLDEATAAQNIGASGSGAGIYVVDFGNKKTAKLSIVKGPTNTSVDDKISPIKVAELDASGKLDPKDDTTITASISSSSTGTGTLSGTTNVSTRNGTASFSNLSINKPGQYVLNFTDSDDRMVASASFQISGAKLEFKGKVSNGVAGSSLDPSVEVELVNSKGKPITNASSLVTLSISGSNASNPITGNTVQLTNGVAVFSSVKLSNPGDYTLSATDDQGDTSALSNQFEITGVHLAFKKQPAETGANARVAYEVDLENSKNQVVNRSSIGVGLALTTIEGGTDAALSSSADTVDFGVANNSGGDPVTINSAGTYTITFTVISQSTDGFDYTIAPITSDPFQVVANHLKFVKQPLSTGVSVPLRYEIVMENYRNQTVTTSADQLQFTLIPSPGESNGILASNVDTLIGGSAINANNMISISPAGTYQLSVVDVPPNPADAVAAGVTSVSFKIKASK